MSVTHPTGPPKARDTARAPRTNAPVRRLPSATAQMATGRDAPPATEIDGTPSDGELADAVRLGE
jgi:hypothetical protein